MFVVEQGVKQIPLTQGKFALIDDPDFQSVSEHKWFAVTDGWNWYAARKVKKQQQRLHNFLMEPPPGVRIDHRDGNGLNCQRRNMRISTHAQNQQNRRSKNPHTSRFKGVSWRKSHKRWVAQIRVDRQVVYLGLFEREEDAARKYDAAAEKHFGEFALTNHGIGLL